MSRSYPTPAMPDPRFVPRADRRGRQAALPPPLAQAARAGVLAVVGITHTDEGFRNDVFRRAGFTQLVLETSVRF